MAAKLPKTSKPLQARLDGPLKPTLVEQEEEEPAAKAPHTGPLPPHARLQHDEMPKGTTQGPALSGTVVDQQRSHPVDVAVDEALAFLDQPVEQAIKLKQLLRQYTGLINRGLPQARLIAAVELLYADNTALSNQLLELTAFVPDGLPVFDHLVQAVSLINEHSHRDSSISDSANLKPSQLSDLLYTQEVAEDEAKPYSFTLAVAQYLTKTLGDVLGPLMKLARSTPAEAAQQGAKSFAARKDLTDLDKAMLDLIDTATVSDKGIAVMELGNAEDFISGRSTNGHAKELLATMQRKDTKGAEANAARALAKLLTMHDAYEMPYGTIALSYDAKANAFKHEDIYLRDYETLAQVQAGLKTYFAFYNGERRHQSLGYQTPDQVYLTGQGGGARTIDQFVQSVSVSTTTRRCRHPP